MPAMTIAGRNQKQAPLSPQDLYFFNEGTHNRLYQKLGAHRACRNGREGVYFSVWAPAAQAVSVVGGFNKWNKEACPLSCRDNSGIWEGFIPGVGHGDLYKFHIHSRHNGYQAQKADPFGFYSETPPKTASIVWDLDYDWDDQAWMRERELKNKLSAPISIYELHLGSWMRVSQEGNRSLTYRELAPQLTAYIKQMNFTHVEFLPLMEHPFYGSWGYQITGYFAPTSRYGRPQDFMYLIDYLHRQGIGVILDWVPSHFPSDGHGLGFFDGTHLYEHEDPRQGFHPDWNSLIFNYGRHEVRSFLLSSALFWFDRYHVDGLRVDGVASMLYLDYSRKDGEWIPNQYGGRENLDAIDFLRRLNEDVYKNYPAAQMFAEESTAWPMVSRPTTAGGLGFGFKWDMGWMHDTLLYLRRDPLYRSYHHHELTFRMIYAFNENFVLPLSHDEVVHGKGSLLAMMPGDTWQKMANLRLLFGYMWAQPGKKLLFMGGEFGQWDEWSHEASLGWHLLGDSRHAGLKLWVSDLNRCYVSEPALHEGDADPSGFEWVDFSDAGRSVLVFLRRSPQGELFLIICNLTPVVHASYRIGVSRPGIWREALNSDATFYGGSGVGNSGAAQAQHQPSHGRPYFLELTLPPLAVLFFKAPADGAVS